MILERFSTPAHLPEPTQAGAEAWSNRVKADVAGFALEFDQFYDPTEEDTPADAPRKVVGWPAFPARLQGLPEEVRWDMADQSRDEQDEYCEWSVEKDGDEIVRVTFTSEMPQYFQHLRERDQVEGTERLPSFYREFVDPSAVLNRLLDADGNYAERNELNHSTAKRLAHLIDDNNLFAAIALVARATVLRRLADGTPVTKQQALVECAGLGDPNRQSDPQIAGAVNSLAATGAEITLEDPVGIYIGGLETTGMVAPDGADAAEFWQIERGDPEHVLRASFSVPEERGYTVSNIEDAGQPIRFGAQLAERVEVKVTAVAKAADHEPERRPCVRPPS